MGLFIDAVQRAAALITQLLLLLLCGVWCKGGLVLSSVHGLLAQGSHVVCGRKSQYARGR